MFTSIYKLKKVLWITVENAVTIGLINTLIYNYIVCPWLSTPTIFIPYGVCVYWMLNLIIRPPQIHLHIDRPAKKGGPQSGLPENKLKNIVNNLKERKV